MKKTVRLIYETLSWLLFFGGVAHAAPLALAIGSFATFLSSGTAFANLVLAGFLTAAKIGLSLLQRASQPQQRPPGIKGSIQVGGDNPLSFIVGYYATAGQKTYTNTYGKNSGDTPNEFLVDVIELGDLPYTRVAQPGDTIWVNGQKCVISSDLDAGGKGYGITEFFKDGKYLLWAKGYDGTQTVVDSYLAAKFGADPQRPWTNDMIGIGIPMVIMTARLLDRTIFNTFPKYKFEVQGVKLYNIAKDSTNGGSGTHRWTDPTTWEFSVNNAVIIYNLTRGIYYGGNWIFGSQNLPALMLSNANWIAAVNECNVAINLVGGGTEPQFRAGYEINCDQQPIDLIDQFLNGCSGKMAELGGYYKIQVGAAGASVYSFTDGDIVATNDLTFDPFPGLEATYNGAHASYPEPGEAWSIKDAPVYLQPAYETADGGRRLLANLTMNTTPYPIQVQRLIKAAVEANRRFRRHVVPLPPEAWLLEPNDTISWTSTREGYSNKKFTISAITGKQGMIQWVSIQEVDPNDYNWVPATDQKAFTFGYLGTVVPPPQAMVGWSVAPATFYDAAASARRPSIAVTFSADQADVRAIRVLVRLTATGSIVFDGELPYGTVNSAITSRSVILNGVFLPNQNYQVSGQFLPYSARETTPSGWMDVLTPNVLLGDFDVYLPGMIADINSVIFPINIDVRALIDQKRKIALKSMDQDNANYKDKTYVLTQIQSVYGSTTAEYKNEILVATGPNSVIAQNLTQLNAAIPTLATASALSSLSTIVSTQGGIITANSDDITVLEATIPTLATASALSSLSATVTTQGGTIASQGTAITANATAITALNVVIGGNAATAFFRQTVEATEAGALSTIGLSVSATTGGGASAASIIISALAGGLSRVGVLADQFFIKSGANSENPFVFSGGIARLNVANIGTIIAGVITDNAVVGSRKFIITPSAGSIEWFD